MKRLAVLFVSLCLSGCGKHVVLATNNPSPNPCVTEKTEIVALIKKFENLQKKGDARHVLELFTSPVGQEESGSYSFLVGLESLDSGKTYYRLYSTGPTAFELKSFRYHPDGIVRKKLFPDSLPEIWQTRCMVTVVEKRIIRNHGDPTPFKRTEEKIVFLDIVTDGLRWKIDRYYKSAIVPAGKYSAWD